MDLKEARMEGARRHPWEIARARTLARIVDGLSLSPRRVLDVGCGDGFTAAEVCGGGEDLSWVGVDPALTEEEIEQLSGRYAQASFVRDLGELEQHSFSLLLLLDVLEHVPDDVGLLRDYVGRALRDDGYVLVTVPAFQSLFSSHDTFLAHYRRYRWDTLRPVLEAGGVKPLRWGYLFSSLLPVRLLSVAWERLRAGRSEVTEEGIGQWKGGQVATEGIAGVLETENRLLLQMERWGLRPPGLSVWALCKKIS
ncbi:MAG: methyltransferase domain-containing protein [Myxococcales bacterium]|nr:methyltransferase domain-containing protein [Myxococcales bacterium]MCB9641526.1 methyltransferase domain-containing protein [Myxococcales bacterium]